jgi:prepilin-type processing-associated H-X9-DG protein
VLAGILLPTLSRAQESARRVKCSSNLRQIGVGMVAYAGNNNGSFPRTYYDPTAGTALVLSANGAQAVNPFTKTGYGTAPGSATTTGFNNVPASMFLLLRTGAVTPETFICPSAESNNEATKETYGDQDSALRRSNFTTVGGVGSQSNLSYSMQVPFPDPLGLQRGAVWDTSMDPGSVLAADMNPGLEPAIGADQAALNALTPESDVDAIQKFNSRNHRTLRNAKEGQNVLYADGHVEFHTSPFAGQPRSDLGTATDLKPADGIYWKSALKPGPQQGDSAKVITAAARPDTPLDTVLMPMANP